MELLRHAQWKTGDRGERRAGAPPGPWRRRLRGYAALRGLISADLVGSLSDDPKLSVRRKPAFSTASTIPRTAFSPTDQEYAFPRCAMTPSRQGYAHHLET